MYYNTIRMAIRGPQHYSSICCSKSLIFGNHLEQLQLWPRPRSNGIGLLHGPRRSTRLPFLLLPHILPLHLRSLPIRRLISVLSPPLRPLLRPRTSPCSSPMSSLTNPPESSSTPPIKTERVAIKGRVQGVYYRDWTVENATNLGLKGWVRNRRDGSVEALFSGTPEKVQEMEQRCRRGPPAAAVTGLQTFPSTDDPGTGFEIRPTV